MLGRQVVVEVVARHIAHHAGELGWRHQLHGVQRTRHGRRLCAAGKGQLPHAADKPVGKGLCIGNGAQHLVFLHLPQIWIGELDELLFSKSRDQVGGRGVVHGQACTCL